MSDGSTTGDANPAQPSVRFPDEVGHLSEIHALLEEDVRAARRVAADQEASYAETKRYMVENRGELDPHEMFQSEILLKQTDRASALSEQALRRLQKLLASPYFARIDFQNTSGISSTYYIGAFAYLRDGSLLISDWRSPVAGMYYDFELGTAWYQSPVGKVQGELTRKRQFRIQDGRLLFVLESGIQIQDDILQQELSRASDEKMKSIIATIQQEQNRIIRNETAHTLIIQGVAGSGKTSVALHRIAYLLYRFQTQLTADSVMILSPNGVFADFIASVLPELGEQPVQTTDCAEIAEDQFDGAVDFAPETDLLAEQDPKLFERTQYKRSPEILRDLDRYIASMPARVFEPADMRFGELQVSREWIGKQFAFYATLPILQRIQRIAENVRTQFEAEPFQGDALPTVPKIRAELLRMLKVKRSLALYKDFYIQMGKAHLFRAPAKHRLEWADVYPCLYLRAAFEGLRPHREIRHLVIDEMQDYAPVQMAVLNLLYPCQKTMLGDFGQAVNPCQSHTLQDLQAVFPGAETVELFRSYRSTWEIVSFAMRFQPQALIKPVMRHGDPPSVQCARDAAAQQDVILATLDAFLADGRATLGIILKTDTDAKRLQESLPAKYKARWIAPGSTVFPSGIAVLSIRMAKGLEFDEVLIPDVDEAHYSRAWDRNLLYVACTRAMHRLTLTCAGHPSGLIGTR